MMPCVTVGSPHSKRCVKSKDMMLKYMEQLGGQLTDLIVVLPSYLFQYHMSYC